MNNKVKITLTALIFILGLFLWSAGKAQHWRGVEEGIDFIEIDSNIWVFKIDTKSHKFKIRHGQQRPLIQWSGYENGGINLNMFTEGNVPNGYTKAEGKVIQPKFNGKYNTFLVWNDDIMTILDRTVHSMDYILSYPNVSQNIRMIKPTGDRNRWQTDDKIWSVSTLASTTDGNILLIHTRAPYQMHDFIDVILSYDAILNVEYMIYLEGGPESCIDINGGFTKPLPYQRMGSYETGFREDDTNMIFWNLPFALTFNWK